MTTWDHWIDGDPSAHRNAVDLIPALDNGTGDLMTWHDRICGQIAAVQNVEVSMADACGRHPYQNFARQSYRLGDGFDLSNALLLEHQRFHVLWPPVVIVMLGLPLSRQSVKACSLEQGEPLATRGSSARRRRLS
jgi:hypothetical protein